MLCKLLYNNNLYITLLDKDLREKNRQRPPHKGDGQRRFF